MKTSSGGNIRIGIVSFMTLVSILLLAVLSVLCVVSANAAAATASRQASSSTELYQVDGMGQALLASMDEELAKSAAAGETAEQAAARIQANLASVESRASQIASAQAADSSDDDLSVSVEVEGAAVRFSVSGAKGRLLDAQVQITQDLGYQVTSWKTSTTQTATGENLWGGASTAN